MNEANNFGELMSYRKLAVDSTQRYEDVLKEMQQALRVYLQLGVVNGRLKQLIDGQTFIEREYLSMKADLEGKIQSRVGSPQALLQLFTDSMEDYAYLKMLKAILEEYRIEHRRREEQERFRETAQNSKTVLKVVKMVSNGVMSLEEVRIAGRISKKNLQETLSKNETFFTVRERNEKLIISLSPVGKRFWQFISVPPVISVKESNTQNYKNCISIISGFDEGLKQGRIVGSRPVVLYGMSQDQKNVVQQKYDNVVKALCNYKISSAPMFGVISVKDDSEKGYGTEMQGEHNGKLRISIKAGSKRTGEAHYKGV